MIKILPKVTLNQNLNKTQTPIQLKSTITIDLPSKPIMTPQYELKGNNALSFPVISSTCLFYCFITQIDFQIILSNFSHKYNFFSYTTYIIVLIVFRKKESEPTFLPLYFHHLYSFLLKWWLFLVKSSNHLL